jgi:SAM-dependent methyltransferase
LGHSRFDADVLAFVRGALPDAPARVLEVGAGKGELAAALRELGHEVLAIDPAGEAPGVDRLPLNRVAEPAASFDAAVAVLSLHHVEPLRESFATLARLVRQGGSLVVDEFDVASFDARAATWWIAQRAAACGDHPADPESLVAGLRRDLHPVSRLHEELSAHFMLGEPERRAYLYRWDLEPGVREAEEELIAAGELPATGVRLVGERR